MLQFRTKTEQILSHHYLGFAAVQTTTTTTTTSIRDTRRPRNVWHQVLFDILIPNPIPLFYNTALFIRLASTILLFCPSVPWLIKE